MRKIRNNKNKSILVILGILLLTITIGYAALNTNLNINGITGISNATWDIHWNNVQVTNGSVSIENGNQAATITQGNTTEVTYAVTLNNPGDFYEFTVDAVNAGSIDGMIDVITSTYKIGNGEVTTITSNNLPAYLNYTVTYSDGREIQQNHLLGAGVTEKYKVRVEFKKDIDASDLPDEVKNLNFSFSVSFKQADVNAIERERYTPFTSEVDVESIQNAQSQYVINQNNCVTYFSESAPDGLDIDAFCRGEDVTYTYEVDYGDGPVTEEVTTNIYDFIDTAPFDMFDEIMESGVISEEQYMAIDSYDVDENVCSEFITNQGWYSDPEDIEKYCSGERDSDDYNIHDDIENGLLDMFMDEGIVSNVTYKEVKPDIVITDYDENNGLDVVIPNNINGRKVVGVADSALESKGITSLSLANTIEFIGYKAFYDNDLTSVSIPSSVGSIGAKAFYENDLSNVQLNNQNTIIGNCAFGDKEEVTTNNIPESYKCIAGCDTGSSDYGAGYTYTNGPYTYTYMSMCPNGQEFCNEFIYGWKVNLTDENSTDPVTANLCNFVDDKPIINMSRMFYHSNASMIDVSSFDTSNVIDMNNMFSNTEATEITGLDNFDTSNVINMRNMFDSLSDGIYELDLGSFDTSNVTDMRYLFSGNMNLKKIYVSDKFTMDNVTNSTNMFANLNSLVGGNGTVWEGFYANAVSMAIIDGNNGMGFFTDVEDKTPKIVNGNITGSCTRKCLKTNDSQGVPDANGLYQDEHGDYRYAGLTPNNYAEFNGEIWRVIGIFGGKIKLMRSDSIGDYSWDSTESNYNGGAGVNQWSPSGTYEGSDLYKLLNDYYYNGVTNGTCYNERSNASTTCSFPGLTSASKSLIDDATWYLGGILDNNVTAAEAYNRERGNVTCHQGNTIGCIGGLTSGGEDFPDDNVVRTTTWVGKIGLIYPSDFGYASSKCRNTSDTLGNYNSGCALHDWLSLKLGAMNNTWTISPVSDKSYSAWGIHNTGTSSDLQGYNACSDFNVFPTIYLKSNVRVTGTGENVNGKRFTFSLQ